MAPELASLDGWDLPARYRYRCRYLVPVAGPVAGPVPVPVPVPAPVPVPDPVPRYCPKGLNDAVCVPPLQSLFVWAQAVRRSFLSCVCG